MLQSADGFLLKAICKNRNQEFTAKLGMRRVLKQLPQQLKYREFPKMIRWYAG
jgi:hypothetical protein